MSGVNSDQLIVFAVLAATLGMFVWNRWRYDIVALMALLVVALVGIVPPDQVFMGLGHPAVITVAAVLVLSRGLLNAGVVDTLSRHLMRAGNAPWIQVAVLTGIVAICSGFMNNVGALALFMPVAVWMSRQSGFSPSLLLMPLAFGSLLGGMLTMIGTPPNIIIASYRAEAGGTPFGMFDFMPVGALVTVVGVAFIALIGWRLTPRREDQDDSESLFEISAYLTELRIPEGCKYAGQTLHDLLSVVQDDSDVMVVGLYRDEQRQEMPSIYKVLREQDILLVEADSDSLKSLIDETGLELAEERSKEENLADSSGDDLEESQVAKESTRVDRSSDATAEEKTEEKPKTKPGKLTLVEAIVTPGSVLLGTTATGVDLRKRFSVNVLAVARQGHRLRQRIGKIRFVAGDILLLQVQEENMSAALSSLGCLPLASRGLEIGRPRKVFLAIAIFALSLAMIALNLVSAATALVCGALVMVLVNLVPPGEIYKSIDMPVIVLLAAMLPVGNALETTGGSQLIADGLLNIAGAVPPIATLAILMTAVMLLSNVVNNAAAAILAAPVAINLAQGMQVSADPFLMAVAIGASSAFLTPIGHQSNTLVMEPGGYQFGDYWRMGLPLSILIVAGATPMILWVWPL